MTNFDISDTGMKMLLAMKEHAGAGWTHIRSASITFLASNKERLNILAALRISGELSETEYNDRLQDEKLMLEAQMHALSIISKAAVQKAVNAAFKVFETAVRGALPG